MSCVNHLRLSPRAAPMSTVRTSAVAIPECREEALRALCTDDMLLRAEDGRELYRLEAPDPPRAPGVGGGGRLACVKKRKH